MSEIIKFKTEGKVIGMSTRWIAHMLKEQGEPKEHKIILRDIRDEFDGEDTGTYFVPVKYTDSKGENRTEYILTELGCIGLFSRYDKKFRRMMEKEWLEFKQQTAPPQLTLRQLG